MKKIADVEGLDIREVLRSFLAGRYEGFTLSEVARFLGVASGELDRADVVRVGLALRELHCERVDGVDEDGRRVRLWSPPEPFLIKGQPARVFAS